MGDGSVGGLSDDPGLDLVGVTLVNGLLHGGGDKDVAGLVHDVLPSVGLSSGEANDGAVLQLVVLQGLGVNAVLVVDAAVPLGDADAGGPGPGEVATGVETDITEALDDVSLAAPAGEVADHAHVVALVDEVVQAVEHSSTCGAGSAMDTSLINGLASDAGTGIHVCVADGVGVGVGDPGHPPLAGAHVGGRDINTGSKEALLGELDGEPPGDPLQLALCVLLGVDLDAGLA